MENRRGEARLTVRADFPDFVKGESIAVNGACLSVEKFGKGFFSAYASQETVSRTTIGSLTIGSHVNLERALALGERLGGHIVSGHVDCIAKVHSVQDAGESRRVRMRFPHAFAPEVIAKGSIALDGISLTVNACGADFLEVNIIPETLQETTAAAWLAGRAVNMETDILGKYVHNMLHVQKTDAGRAEESDYKDSLAFLRENGFV